jgi:DNA-binding response OmpR family regulator
MKKILFIEDESALQKTFSDLLETEGHKLISALNGKVGLEIAKKERPDLILLDLILPKINGFEVLKRLKADEDTKNIPVIVLTNLEGVDDINKALELGTTTYLVKGQYSLDDVLKKIKDCIEGENPC